MRLRLVADSSLLSQHHASRAPADSAAPASSPPSHGWKREAEELRALLAVLREQLDAVLATHAAPSTATAPASAENTETDDARGEMDVEDPEASGGGLVPPAASEAPLPSAAASAWGTWKRGAEPLQPDLGADGPASGPAGAQLEHGGGVSASWLAEPRSEPPQPEFADALYEAFTRLDAELGERRRTAYLETERTTIAGSLAEGRVLADEVRRLQRTRPGARAKWAAYCDEQFFGVKDPLKHTVASLNVFICPLHGL